MSFPAYWYRQKPSSYMTTKIFVGWVDWSETASGCDSVVIHGETPVLLTALSGAPSRPHSYSEEDQAKIMEALRHLDEVIASCSPIYEPPDERTQRILAELDAH